MILPQFDTSQLNFGVFIMLLFFAIGIGIILFANIYIAYQIFKMISLDASYRALAHPKFWSWFAISGQRGEGLLFYLLKRKEHPRNPLSDQDAKELSERKKKTKIALIFLFLGIVLFLLTVLFDK